MLATNIQKTILNIIIGYQVIFLINKMHARKNVHFYCTEIGQTLPI